MKPTKIATWRSTTAVENGETPSTPRPRRIERLGAGHRRQDRLAPEQHDRGQHEDERRDDREDGGGQRRRLAAQAARRADDEEDRRRRRGSSSRRRSAPRRAGSAASPNAASLPRMTIPIISALMVVRATNAELSYRATDSPRVAPADPGQDRDRRPDHDRRDVDRDIERARVLDAGEAGVVPDGQADQPTGG